MAKKEGPAYYLRLLKEILSKGLTKRQAHNMLAGVGKHARQRKRKKDHWERKWRLKRERKEAARKTYRAKAKVAKRRRKKQKRKGRKQT